MSRPLVLIESPYAAPRDTPPEERAAIVARNVEYARRCMRDSFLRGESPWCSHLVYTQPGILDDDNADERALGIEAGLQWGRHAEITAVYDDYGISRGMELGIDRAHQLGRKVTFRRILEQAP